MRLSTLARIFGFSHTAFLALTAEQLQTLSDFVASADTAVPLRMMCNDEDVPRIDVAEVISGINVVRTAYYLNLDGLYCVLDLDTFKFFVRRQEQLPYELAQAIASIPLE